MAAPVPELAELPQIIQIIIYIAVGIAAGGLALYSYRHKPHPAPTEDIVITGASLADSRPMRDLAASVAGALPILSRMADSAERDRQVLQATLDRVATAVEAIEERMRREADDERQDRLIEEVARRVEAQRRPPSRPRKRVPKTPSPPSG